MISPSIECISVIVPVHNEAENVTSLLAELSSVDVNGIPLEFVFVDDASDDETLNVLKTLQISEPRLRILCHDKTAGQSTAIRTGVVNASCGWIVTMDGDGQNDPADIPKFVQALDGHLPGEVPFLVAGDRSHLRKDSTVKRITSKIANSIRNFLLKENCPDSGCGMKLFSRESFLNLPYFNHMHRFLPTLYLRSGGKILMVATNHRPRNHGSSHYGTWGRMWAGIVDLLGVMWLRRRAISVAVKEVKN